MICLEDEDVIVVDEAVYPEIVVGADILKLVDVMEVYTLVEMRDWVDDTPLCLAPLDVDS